jgi:hypothetical protein
MDNHKGAYAFWKSLSIRNATCIHVDAHLDVSNFAVPEPGDLENPTLNCGNFLLPAIEEHLIDHLIWVMPPHLAAGSPTLLRWAQDELQNWMWLTLSDYRSLRLEEGRVVGTLAGARLTICTLDRLPPLAPPLLVDVDIDYFFDPSDRIWQPPETLCARLQPLAPEAVTIATSVEGGYTPPGHRCLGRLVLAGLTGSPDEARDPRSDRDRPDDPAWLRAARLVEHADCASSAWNEAAALDPECVPRAVDVAAWHLLRKRYDACLEWLARVDDPETAGYLRGLVAFRQERFAAAEEEWSALATLPIARGAVAAHLFEMRARAQAGLGLDEEVLISLHLATRHTPQNASLWRQLGRIQLRCGQSEAGARSLRRAIALAPHDLATLLVRWELAQVYLESGQAVLARAELARVIAEDDGALAAKARLLALKLEAGSVR